LRWRGKWVSDGELVNYRPASYFRKEFISEKKIKKARAYITAAGLYELSINGEKVSDEMLNPMYTRFDKRNLYSTFDITSLLKMEIMWLVSSWGTVGSIISPQLYGSLIRPHGAIDRHSLSTLL